MFKNPASGSQLVANYKEIIESRQAEISSLRGSIEQNPLLAEGHAKVIDLELRIKNMMTESINNPQTMDQILCCVDKVLKMMDEHKAGLEILEYEVE